MLHSSYIPVSFLFAFKPKHMGKSKYNRPRYENNAFLESKWSTAGVKCKGRRSGARNSAWYLPKQNYRAFLKSIARTERCLHLPSFFRSPSSPPSLRPPSSDSPIFPVPPDPSILPTVLATEACPSRWLSRTTACKGTSSLPTGARVTARAALHQILPPSTARTCPMEVSAVTVLIPFPLGTKQTRLAVD